MSLESDNGEEEQEVLVDLENEEQEEKGAGEVGEQRKLDQESVPHYCAPCQGDVCRCKDSQQVNFFTDDEEYYGARDVASNIHPGGLDQDKRYWSSEDENVEEAIHTEVTGVDGLLYQVGEENVGVNKEEEPEAGQLYITLYGSLEHSLNLDGHGELCSEEKGEEVASTGVGLEVTEVGTENKGTGEQVSGGSNSGLINIVSGGGKVETSLPDPLDTPSEEDGGDGSGADSAVRQAERAVVWFPQKEEARKREATSQSLVQDFRGNIHCHYLVKKKKGTNTYIRGIGGHRFAARIMSSRSVYLTH